MKVKLSAIADALEKSEVLQGFVDLQEGRVLLFGDEFEDGRTAKEESEEERLHKVFSIEDQWQRYAVLPNIYEDERTWREMFVGGLNDEEQQSCLRSALHGDGGVQRFNHTLKQLQLEKAWQEFFQLRLLDTARDWCEEYDVEYEE